MGYDKRDNSPLQEYLSNETYKGVGIIYLECILNNIMTPCIRFMQAGVIRIR